MSKEKTPEQLLSEALRAKAVQAPVHAPPPLPNTEPPSEPTPAQQGTAAEPDTEDRPAATEPITNKEPDNSKDAGESQESGDPKKAEEHQESAEREESEDSDETGQPQESGEPEETEPIPEPSAPVRHESLFADNDASFELLSGHDYQLPQMSAPTAPSSTVSKSRPLPPPLGAAWILLLAVVLGAAAGAVAGLLTLR